MTGREKQRLGKAIRAVRLKAGLGQHAMAARLRCSQTGVSAYERGLVPESWAFLWRLHKEFGVDLNDLSKRMSPRRGE